MVSSYPMCLDLLLYEMPCRQIAACVCKPKVQACTVWQLYTVDNLSHLYAEHVHCTFKEGGCPVSIEVHSLQAAQVVMLSQRQPSIGLQLIEPCLHAMLLLAACSLQMLTPDAHCTCLLQINLVLLMGTQGTERATRAGHIGEQVCLTLLLQARQRACTTLDHSTTHAHAYFLQEDERYGFTQNYIQCAGTRPRF